MSNNSSKAAPVAVVPAVSTAEEIAAKKAARYMLAEYNEVQERLVMKAVLSAASVQPDSTNALYATRMVVDGLGEVVEVKVAELKSLQHSNRDVGVFEVLGLITPNQAALFGNVRAWLRGKPGKVGYGDIMLKNEKHFTSPSTFMVIRNLKKEGTFAVIRASIFRERALALAAVQDVTLYNLPLLDAPQVQVGVKAAAELTVEADPFADSK
jgi:hypothetical protein